MAITVHLWLKKFGNSFFATASGDILLSAATLLHHSFTGTSISRASLHLLVLSAFLSSLMSSVKNNIGRGLNIALVNGESGGH